MDSTQSRTSLKITIGIAGTALLLLTAFALAVWESASRYQIDEIQKSVQRTSIASTELPQ